MIAHQVKTERREVLSQVGDVSVRYVEDGESVSLRIRVNPDNVVFISGENADEDIGNLLKAMHEVIDHEFDDEVECKKVERRANTDKPDL